MSKHLLKEITSKIGSGATPTGGKGAYKGGDYSLIRSQNVLDISFLREGLVYINDEQAKKLDGVKVESGDVLFNITGDSICRCCIVPDDILPARVNQHVAIIRPKSVNSAYLMYYLQYLKPYLMSICGNGSSRNALTKDSLEKLEIEISPFSNSIAEILSSLDKKIINNKRITSELESFAKTIYDYWFLQFEFPNEEGKPYKSSGGKMVWCEELKREIPEGWELTTLGEMFHITMGSSPKGDSLNEVKCGIEFYQGSTDFGNIYPNERVYTTSPIRKATSQDVLLSVRAPVGDMNIAMNDCCIGRGLAAIHSESTLLTWNTLKSLHSYFDVYNNNGTTFGALTADSLKGLITLNIPPRLIQEYEKQVSGFEKIIRNKELESRSLSSLRDFLLPMLMNGQVTFKDN